jgi:hypothetical protein
VRTWRARGIAAAIVGIALLAVLASRWGRPTGYELWVYGFADEPAVQQVLADLDEAGLGDRVVFADLAKGDNGERFSSLMTAINAKADIPFLPDSVERRLAPPYVHLHNQNRYYDDYLSSFTGVFRAGKLVAVVVGATWQGDGFWPGLLDGESLPAGTRVFTASGTYDVTDEAIIAELTGLLRNPQR